MWAADRRQLRGAIVHGEGAIGRLALGGGGGSAPPQTPRRENIGYHIHTPPCVKN